MSSESSVAAESDEVGTMPNRLKCNIDIKDSGPCCKEVKVSIPQDEVARIRQNTVAEYSNQAEIPGFRVGYVPVKLVERRFKEEITDRTKRAILMDSLDQVTNASKIEPLGEPNLDIDTITLPDEGDFEYEFSIEVRPQFALPEFGSMTIERHTKTFTDEDVDASLKSLQFHYGEYAPVEDAAQQDDSLTANLEFTYKGDVINTMENVRIRVCETVSFYDGEIQGFDKLVVGATKGEERQADIVISSESSLVEMRGETVHLKMFITQISRVKAIDDYSKLLGLFNMTNQDELKNWLREINQKQLDHRAREEARHQVMEKISESASWDLPESLVSRQVENALRREVLEMRQAGYTRQQISAQENQLRQRSITSTRNALKQHFILDKLATEQSIEVSPEEIDREIANMAQNEGENPRRLRAKLVKSDMIDNLEAQLRERKAVDFILDKVQLKDIPPAADARKEVYPVNREICRAEPTTSVVEQTHEHDQGHECDENCDHDHDH
jgi:trigger factor